MTLSPTALAGRVALVTGESLLVDGGLGVALLPA